ncbi:hypothetical protein P9047_33540, partial [Bacillus thuringiensis]|nr:hypothetical protein [Bacillus thuringiensis]
MNKADHSVNKEYICQLLFQTFEIPVRFCDKNKKILHENVSSDMRIRFYWCLVDLVYVVYMDVVRVCYSHLSVGWLFFVLL